MKRVLFILFFLYTLISCKQENKIDIQKKEIQHKISFTKYPATPCSDSSYINYFIKPSEQYLNLYSLENGVDSFEMRVYSDAAFHGGIVDLYLIKKVKDSLQKCLYYFSPQLIINPDGSKSKFENTYSLMTNFTFENSDSTFIKLINKFQIDTFPTQTLIPNKDGGCFDGILYTIEIATKNSYRILRYHNPDCYPNSMTNKNFDLFINTFLASINRKKIKYYSPYSN